MFLPDWAYDGNDPGLKLFTLANPLLPPTVTGARVFEIGSQDTDFLERVEQADPSLIVRGMDWRADDRPKRERGDIMTAHVEDADAIISLSAIEHIGLMRYGDPADPYGDVKTVQRVRDWLKPGGWFYFDVPYTPEGFQLLDTNKCRCYNDYMLRHRFGPHRVLGYTSTDVEGWIDKPTRNAPDPQRPYWYVALLITH